MIAEERFQQFEITINQLQNEYDTIIKPFLVNIVDIRRGQASTISDFIKKYQITSKPKELLVYYQITETPVFLRVNVVNATKNMLEFGLLEPDCTGNFKIGINKKIGNTETEIVYISKLPFIDPKYLTTQKSSKNNPLNIKSETDSFSGVSLPRFYITNTDYALNTCHFGDVPVSGSMLLDFVHQFSLYFGSTLETLEDDSTIFCEKEIDGQRGFTQIDLYKYYLMRDGKTWYQKQGFEPTAKRFDETIKSVKEFPMSDVLGKNSKKLDVFLDKVGINKSDIQNENVGQFLTLVYKQDCSFFEIAWKLLSIVANEKGLTQLTNGFGTLKNWLEGNSKVKFVRKV